MTDLTQLEHNNLRQELHDLKSCQIIFLQLSVAGTGLLLGVGLRWDTLKSFEYIYLLPLVIVLPAWWIFFDKATTITRAVGYYRILEKLLLGRRKPPRWSGWENSLRLFRKEAGDIEIRQSQRRILEFLKLIFLLQPYRYWMIVYYTFLGLSGMCWVLMFIQSASYSALVGGSAVIGFTAFWNIRLVYLLVLGRHSYDSNERIWRKILYRR